MEIRGVTESIAHHLRDQIITGELPPGFRLNEVELAKKLKVSRAPLREAFRVLENDRLIIRMPRHGSYVADLNAEHLEEVFEARRMIENHVLDILESRSIKALPKAEKALDASLTLSFPSLSDKHAMLEYVTTLTHFHVGLIEAAENNWITKFYQSITVNLTRYQFICLYIPGLTKNSYEMHERILRNIKKNDFGKARELLLSHIDSTADLIKEEIRCTKCHEQPNMPRS